jgi:hypothetical protein
VFKWFSYIERVMDRESVGVPLELFLNKGNDQVRLVCGVMTGRDCSDEMYGVMIR